MCEQKPEEEFKISLCFYSRCKLDFLFKRNTGVECKATLVSSSNEINIPVFDLAHPETSKIMIGDSSGHYGPATIDELPAAYVKFFYDICGGRAITNWSLHSSFMAVEHLDTFFDEESKQEIALVLKTIYALCLIKVVKEYDPLGRPRTGVVSSTSRWDFGHDGFLERIQNAFGNLKYPQKETLYAGYDEAITPVCSKWQRASDWKVTFPITVEIDGCKLTFTPVDKTEGPFWRSTKFNLMTARVLNPTLTGTIPEIVSDYLNKKYPSNDYLTATTPEEALLRGFLNITNHQ